MKGIYENLLELAELYEGERDSTEIAEMYQKTQDPIYLSTIFCDYYLYVKSIANQYFNITDEDKGSFALEELHKAMMDYDSSKGAKVETLFITYLRNRLRTETQAMEMQKRRANNSCEDFDDSEVIFYGYEDNKLDIAEIEIALKQSELFSDNELAYCRIIMEDDNTKDSDVAKILEVSASAVHQMKKRIAKKLDEINFTRHGSSTA